MAEGFARTLGQNTIVATSAGLNASQVNPNAVQVMAEVGIDISQQTSDTLTDFNPQHYDAAISLCGCGTQLPSDWKTRPIFADWQLEDPAGKPLETFRHVRDQIEQQVTELLQSLQQSNHPQINSSTA